jgi:hypothetical protein
MEMHMESCRFHHRFALISAVISHDHYRDSVFLLRFFSFSHDDDSMSAKDFAYEQAGSSVHDCAVETSFSRLDTCGGGSGI